MKYLKLITFAAMAATMSLTSCSDDDDNPNFVTCPDTNSAVGLFIINEGNFGYGNASISYYDPETKTVENEVFARANEMKLGDVAQSMTIHGDNAWIVVNNSHIVYAIDKNTYKEKGRIENMGSPRYIHFLNDEKAYVTQLYDNRIYIINPKTYSITGYITIPDVSEAQGTTDMMVQDGKYVYCNCWSYQNCILKIDTTTDQVVDKLTVGVQPTSLVIDNNNKMWTVTDGGWEGNPFGYEAPSLWRIDVASFKVETHWDFAMGSYPSEMQIDGTGDNIFWLNGDKVYKMNVNDTEAPAEGFINGNGTYYYGLTINPKNGEIYVADAIDYVQNGQIKRFDALGSLLDSFYVGVIPGAFCWK